MPRQYSPHEPESDAKYFWTHVEKTDSCWLWTASKSPLRPGKLQYGQATWNHRTILAHRVSWMIAHGPIPQGRVVRHTCDNPLCVRPSHLLLGTHQDNADDAVSRHRTSHSERHFRAVLSGEDVREIRRLRAEGMTQVALSERFGVSRRNIRAIIGGQTWQHLP